MQQPVRPALELETGAVPGSPSRIEVHPRPEGIPGNREFTAKVRVPGGAWREVDSFLIEVDMHDPRPAAAACFDFTGVVEVSVAWHTNAIRSVVVRPLSRGIRPVVEDRTLTFTLDRPGNFAVEINGNRFRVLHLLAGPIEEERPDPADPDVIYFGPGVHEPGDTLAVPGGTTVYLAAGAVLKSRLLCHRVEDVRILGRGVLYRPERGIEITFSKRIEIDGITVINPTHYTVYGGQSRDVTIRNLKAFSSTPWSDGIDLMSCSDVLVEGVFLRTSDDCIAVYGHRWDYYGDVRNITVRDASLWADVAHPVLIGTHGNPSEPEVIEHLVFENLDILNHHEPQVDYQGCFAINPSDGNLVVNGLPIGHADAGGFFVGPHVEGLAWRVAGDG